MTSPDYALLAAEGQAFRASVLTEEFLSQAGSHIGHASDVIIGQYAQTELYHVTHSSSIAAIQEEGLCSGKPLIDPEDEQFFVEQFTAQQERRIDYNDRRVVSKYIFGREDDGTPRGVYATAQADELHVETFAIPERLTFFMRNLRHLQHLGEVSVDARGQAQQVVQKYASRLLVNDQIEAGVFRLDPRSPAVAQATIGQYNFAGIDDEFGLSVMRQVQQDTMVEIKDPVAPQYLELTATHIFDGQALISSILDRTGQVVFRPVAQDRQ